MEQGRVSAGIVNASSLVVPELKGGHSNTLREVRDSSHD